MQQLRLHLGTGPGVHVGLYMHILCGLFGRGFRGCH